MLLHFFIGMTGNEYSNGGGGDNTAISNLHRGSQRNIQIGK